MATSANAQALNDILDSLGFIIPEIVLVAGLIIILITGLFRSFKNSRAILLGLSVCTVIISLGFTVYDLATFNTPATLFLGSLRTDDYSLYFRLLIDFAGLLTFLLSVQSLELKDNKYLSEYCVLILAILLGSHLLVMTSNFILLFISLELISLPSYVLTGFGSRKNAIEGSLKYFLFGSVATAIMVYGFSLLYGLSGSLDYSSVEFIKILHQGGTLILVAGLLALAGFLYKVASAPLHLWAPDVYEASPMPVVALFSVAPKLAGVAALSKFSLALNMFGQSSIDWQLILGIVIILSLTIGNFAALWQSNPKRMMAYSSIAQSGFLLVGICTFTLSGYQFTLFYATVYLMANFAVFALLQSFSRSNVDTIPAFAGSGKSDPYNGATLLIALISLAGIPPTAGFMGKLFVFSGVWDVFAESGKVILLTILIVGLLNTVVSIFYYLKIPYHSFFKPGNEEKSRQIFGIENLLAFILVIGLLILFIKPDFLMGWLNRVNFVL